jgi:hypothetical protein
MTSTTPPPVYRAYTRTGRKAHFVPIARLADDKQAPALCNYRVPPLPGNRWHGPGGGAQEATRARSMTLCTTCEKVLALWGDRNGEGWRA